jgi:hypothetical protein
MEMDDKDVGNGKAPFGHEGEEEGHKEVQEEVHKEVQKEVQEEEPEVGKGKWGSVEMVTYNSLTVDPVLGKFSAHPPSPSCRSGLTWTWSPQAPRLILYASCVIRWMITMITTGFPSDELQVIAWHDDIRKSEDGTVVPVKTIQGLAHRRKPRYGVQFHPEVSSICLFLSRVLAMSSFVLNHGPFFYTFGVGVVVDSFFLWISPPPLILTKDSRIPYEQDNIDSYGGVEDGLPAFDEKDVEDELDVQASRREPGCVEGRVEGWVTWSWARSESWWEQWWEVEAS